MHKYTNTPLLFLAVLGLSSACGSDSKGATANGDGDSSMTGDGDSSGDVQIDSIDTTAGEKVADANMVDDLDDNDDNIMDNDAGRVGSWYVFHDDTSTGATQTPGDPFKPTAGGADDSKYAAGTTGKGYKDYAGLAVDFNNDGKTKKAYDASKFKGITFLAKGNVDLRIGFSTVATAPKDDGGSCTAGEDKCDDSFGVNITTDKEWGKFDIPFAKLKQEGWGAKATWDAKTLLGLTFSVPENASFDFAIDDVGFF